MYEERAMPKLRVALLSFDERELRVRKNYQVGDEMPMTVWRDGEYLEVVLDLQEAAG